MPPFTLLLIFVINISSNFLKYILELFMFYLHILGTGQ